MTIGKRTYEGLAVPLKGESKIEQETLGTDILSIKGAASQTGDFLVFMDSDEAEKSYIDSAGAFHGLVIQGGSDTNITEDGAIPITTLFSAVWPDGSDGSTATALTLADGVVGQMKVVRYDDGTCTVDVVVTPAHFANGTSFTLDAGGDTALLVFDGTNWCSVSNDGTIA